MKNTFTSNNCTPCFNLVRYASKVASLILIAAFFVSSVEVKAQCNVALESAGALTPSCAGANQNLGPGAYKSITTVSGVWYTYNLTTTGTNISGTVPLCVGGTSYANNQTLQAGGTSVNVGTNRTSNGAAVGGAAPQAFAASVTSSVLNYRIADPTTPTISSAPAAVCKGGTTAALTGNAITRGSGTWSCTAAPSGGSTGHITFSDAASPTSTATVNASAVAGNYTLRWRANNGGCTLDATTTLTVASDPSITTQPTAPADICQQGTSANMSVVAANGTPSLAYQWQYYNGSSWVNAVANVPLSGTTYANATAASNFSVSGITAAGTYPYRCQITASGAGCDAIETSTRNVVVVADPSITTDPVNATVCKGGSNVFSIVSDNGTPSRTYQWEYNNGGTWENVGANPTGVTYANGTTENLTVTTSGTTPASAYEYRCLVKASGSGCNDIRSASATLTVNDVPAISSQPTSVNVCEGTTVNFSMNATGGIPTIGLQWQYNNGGVWGSVADDVPSVGVTYSGNTTNALTINNLTGGTGSASYQYRCMVTSLGNGCNTVYTSIVTAGVHKYPSITNNSQDMCENTSKALTTDLDATSGVTWTVSPVCVGCITTGPNTFNAPTGLGGGGNYVLTARNANLSTCSNFYIQTVKSPDPADAGLDIEQCNTSSFTMAANAPLYGTGTWSVTSGSASISSPNSNTSSVTLTAGTPPASGTATLRWRIVNGSGPGACTSDDFVVISNYAPPSTATVGATQDRCATLTSAALGGNTPTNGNGAWSQVSGPGTSTFSAPTSGSSTATADAYGTYVYRWTISNGPICIPTEADITVNYTEQATVGATQDRCATLTSTALGGNTPTVGSGAWSQFSGPGTTTFSAPTSGSSTATADAYGTYVYRWTLTGPNGNCTSTADITVNYTEQATVGSTQDRCATLTSAALGGNTPSAGSGAWSQVSGPGTSSYSASTSGSSTATATLYGTYVYRWTLTSPNAGCNTTADITVNYAEQATVGTEQDRCATLTSAALGGNTPSVGSGAWSQFSGPGTTTFSAPTSGSSTATADAYGTYVYRWTLTNGSCNTTADITVNYTEQATVGTEQDRCATLTSTALGGNTPTVGSGAWSQLSGPGTTTFSAPASGSSTATADAYGTYVYRWTLSGPNAGCNTTADVTVNYTEQATVGSTQDRCATLTSAALGGNTPSAGSGAWSQVSGPGTSTFSAPTSGSSTATADAYGTYVYRWTLTSPNAGCNTTADITVNYSEGATVGAEQDRCATLTSAALGGNTPTLGSGAWSQFSGPGTSTFSAPASGSSTATADAYGTYVYRWTLTNGSCNTTADITVNYTEQATVGSTQDRCATLTSAALGGNTPSAGTGFWFQVSGPGSTTFGNTAVGNTTATATAYGTYVYRWNLSGPGFGCTTYADITVNYAEQATVGTEQDRCATLTSAALGGNTPAVGTGAWSQFSGPGTTTFSAPTSGSSTATADTYGTYVYRWTLTNGSCNTTADITVNYTEQATVGSTQDRCATLTSAALGGNTPSAGSGAWSQVSGPGTSSYSASTSGSSTATATLYGTYVYRWTLTSPNAGCNTTADITVNYAEQATVGSTQDRCATLTSAALGGNTPAVGSGAWSQFSGPGTTTFSAPTSGSSTATADAYGTYVYRWTLTNGSCNTTADITVNYTEQATVGTEQDRCATLTSAALGGNTPTVGSGAWSQLSGPGTTTFSAPASGSSTATADAYGTYVYRWTLSGPNAGCNTTADVTVNYTEQATVGSTQDRCATLTSAALGGNTPSAGSGAWSQVSGPGTSTFSAPTSGSSTATADAYGTYVYRWTLTSPNAGCNTTADITVNYSEGATVGAEQDRCATLTSAALGGNTPTLGSGAWSQFSGPGTSTFSAPASGSSTATADAYGTYVYRWTLTNGSCNTTADITVNYTEQATVGATQDRCATLTSTALGGNTPSVGSGAWSQVSGPGTTTFSAPTSGSSTATADAYGTYVYRWTLTSPNAGCNTTADITVNYAEQATVGTEQDRCATLTSAALGGNTPSVGSGAWSQFSGPGTTTFSAPTSGSSTATADAYGTYVYRWTLTNGSCNSSADITVNYTEQSTVGADQDACGLTSAALGGNTPSAGSGAWSQVSGPGTSSYSAPTSGSSTATATLYGTYVYRWTLTSPNAGCNTTADVSVKYDEAVTGLAAVVAPNPVCEGTDVTLTATLTTGNSLTWAWSGPNSFSAATQNTGRTNVQLATDQGVYTVSATNNCGTVSANTASLVITTSAPSATAAITNCMNANVGPTANFYYVTVSGSGGNGAYTWSGSPIMTVSGTEVVYEEPAGSTTSYTVTDAAGCVGTSNTVNVTSGNPTTIPSSTTLSVDCYSIGLNKWLTFTDNANQAILSVNDQGDDLGVVTANVYVDGAPVDVTQTIAPVCQGYTYTGMARHYVISSTNTFSAAKVRLYFTDDEFNDLVTASFANNTIGDQCTENDDISNLSELYLTKYDGPDVDGNYLNNSPEGSGGIYRVFGDANAYGTPDGPMSKVGSGFGSTFASGQNHHYVELEVNEFSEFWLHGSLHGAALPVRMLFLEAVAMNNSYIKVNWATATEIDNAGFFVERSTDGQNWQQIDWVAGNNNSTVRHDYSIDDRNVTADVRYYYRLKQIDNDGDFEYTNIVSAIIRSGISIGSVTVRPNPTTGNTTIVISSTKDTEVKVALHDILGQEVSSVNTNILKGGNEIVQDWSMFAAGTYTITVTSENEIRSIKLVIYK